MPVYAVKIGRTPGVYDTWAECEAQVKGFPDAKYKKQNSKPEAWAWIRGETLAAAVSTASVAVSASTSSSATKRSFLQAATGQVVYSDGACKDNGKPGARGGIGVYWGDNDPRNLSERCPGAQTNNRAELIAIVRILEETPFTTDTLCIRTDSKYSINCLDSWIKKWILNGWRTDSGPVKNMELIQYLKAHLDTRAQRGQTITLEYVKGHSGNPGNDAADQLAVAGTFLPVLPDRDWVQLKTDLLAGAAVEKASASAVESPSKLRKTSAAPVSPTKRGQDLVGLVPTNDQDWNDYAAGISDDPAADLSF
ncbi:ribonuclease H-like domain-containing protein [Mycena amicta]|nr:ribonuclease H-like domain-containing protein [Mycena amicta]